MRQSTRTLHPNIHKLVISQALSKLGDNFTEVALALFVLAITRRNVTDLGIVLAMAYLPSILLGWAVAGVIDRFNKRKALLISDVVRAVLVASIPVVHNYAWTVAAVFMMYCFAMVYRPIVRAVQPQIAGSAEINAQSGARQQTYYSIADMAAYLAAAGVLFLWGVTPAFWVDAATYVGAALFLLGIRMPREFWLPTASGASRFWAQVSEGYRYLKNASRVAQLTLLSVAVALATASINTLLAPLSQAVWHVSSHHYVWLLMAIAVGGFLSGAAVERFGLVARFTARPLIALGFALTASGFGLALIAGVWWLGALCLVLAGVGNALFGTAIMFWVQQSTPAEVRVRVLSIRSVGMGLGGALGAWLGGLLGQVGGISHAVLLVAGLWMVLAIWTLAASALRGSTTPRTAAQNGSTDVG